jgi:hypothetical protein
VAAAHREQANGQGIRWRGITTARGQQETAAAGRLLAWFVPDAFGAWLVEQLADAGRKKLTELMLGSEQERALRKAAGAAVWATAEEMSPPGDGQAGQLAMVISEVFRDPVPDMPQAGPVTLLEDLEAGIAGQLAVLDDAELTGTGQSSADVLGVPGAVLADRLTGHLVRVILVRGCGGGPLTPLAGQLNHELTRLQGHMQGQRIEGMLAQLAADVRDALVRPGNDAVAGRPLDEVTDPFALEVHRPIQPEDRQPGLPALPAYVPRDHDRSWARWCGRPQRAAAGSRCRRSAVLVGGSSTGKTRACWEALQLLRDQSVPWRLWHPIDPSRRARKARARKCQVAITMSAACTSRLSAAWGILPRCPGRSRPSPAPRPG